MTVASISDIIDIHLLHCINNELNNFPGYIEPEMAGTVNTADDDEVHKWFPVKSIVTDKEIEELEKQLNFHLPGSYKIYLKHIHFYEIYISEARFSGQQIRGWRRHLIDMAFDGYPREFLIDKGYIPFADWSDWGLLCFDTNQPGVDYEYSVILWDHERFDEFIPYSDNFHSLLLKLNKESKINAV